MSKSQPLSITHPELAAQAVDWDPGSFTFGSHAKKEWKCKIGHTWIASIAHRARGTGCPVCSGNVTLAGFNDLATTDPEIAKQAHGWDPSLVARSSNRKFTWKCSLGHIWEVAPNQRSSGYGCPICAGVKVLPGFNDLATTDPEIASQAFGWDPTIFSRGSDSKKEWKCESGHIFTSSLSNRVSGRGCHFCSGHKVLVGFNDLETTDPEIAAKAFGWDPKSVSRSSAQKKEWKCKEGHIWSAVVHSVVRSPGSGCPICGGKKILKGFNDLATTDPEIAKEAFGWDPSSFTRSSNGNKNWKCSLGHVWKTSINHRSTGTGCPTCATSGYDPNSPGWLYFLKHDEWEMLQIGITNFPKERLHRHEKIGWEVLELRGPMEGDLARQWETDILRMLRKKNAALGLSEIAGKFTGYTESWMKASFPVNSLKELMEIVRSNEDQA
jgi:hypothetical protein